MALNFVKATKKRSKARIAIDGPSGSGKTYTALIAATVFAKGGKIAVIDTERGSASLYSGKFDFDVLELDMFSPQIYIDAIESAEASGYSVIVIDSLSHAWEGEGGALDMVDKAAKRSQSGNSYTAWKDVTPLQRRLVDTMLQSKCHIIATMRSKMDYVQEKDERTGKTVIRKVGMAPIQRQGMEYEFTIVGDMDIDHNLMISKSRCEAMADAVVNKPNEKFFATLLNWLDEGDPVPEKEVHTHVDQPKTNDVLETYMVERPWTNTRVTEETALNETSSNGVRYWLMDNESLENGLAEISAAIEKGTLKSSLIDEAKLKRDIISAILEYRTPELEYE